MSSKASRSPKAAPKLELARLAIVFNQADKAGLTQIRDRAFRALIKVATDQVHARLSAHAVLSNMDLVEAAIEGIVDEVLRAESSKQLESWLSRLEERFASKVEAAIEDHEKWSEGEHQTVSIRDLIDPTMSEECLFALIETKRIINEPNDRLWQEALTLTIEGYTYQEIAATLGVKVAKVASWIKAIRLLLEDYARLAGKNES